MQKFSVGDHVIYHTSKVSQQPGPRAEGIRPAPRGDDYSYAVEKFWTVSAVDEDGTSIEIRTRRGKRRTLRTDDPRLRKAHFWEEIAHRGQFPDLAGLPEGAPDD